MDLADAVDCAHYQLVQVSTEEQIRLETESDKQDVPNEFTALLADLQLLAHLLNRTCCYLPYPIEEHLELVERLFLCLFSGMHLCESLLWLHLLLLLPKSIVIIRLNLPLFDIVWIILE